MRTNICRSTSGKARFITLAFLWNFLAIHLLSYFGYLADPDAYNTALLEGWSPGMLFVVSVLLGPLVETLLFQFVILESVMYYLGRSQKAVMVACAVSSLCFGLSHAFGAVYMAVATCMGIFLALTYVCAKFRRDVSPFLLVYGIHAGINLLAFTINEVFKF